MKEAILLLLAGAVLGWLVIDVVQTRRAAEGMLVKETRSLSILNQRRVRVALPTSLQKSFSLSTPSLEALMAIQQAHAEVLESWLRQLVRNPSHDSAWARLLFSRLVELDWKRALDLAASVPELERYRHEAIRAWAEDDLAAAVEEWFRVDPSGDTLSQLLRDLDGEKALKLYDLLRDRGFDASEPRRFSWLIGKLYEAGPEQAVRKALDHALGKEDGEDGLEYVMERWVEDDPEAALAWVERLGKAADKKLALSRLAEAWAEEDPKACLEKMWGQLDVEQRTRLTDQLGRAMGKTVKAQQILTLIDEYVESEVVRSRFLYEAVTGLQNSDRPQALADLVTYLNAEDGMMRSAIESAARRWAEIDGEGMSEWLDTVEDPHVRKAAVRALVGDLAQRDPRRALEIYAAEAAASGNQSLDSWGARQFLESLAATGEDPQAVIAELPEAARAPFLESYVRQFADQAPGEAVAFLQVQPVSRERERALQEAIGRWAGMDPEQAAVWINDLPAGDQRAYASRNLVRNWARHDPEAAQDWYATLPAGAPREAAAWGLAEALKRRDPAASLALLRDLPHDEAHERLMNESIQVLADRDVDQARAWLDEVTLPEASRDKVQQRIDQAAAMQAFFDREDR